MSLLGALLASALALALSRKLAAESALETRSFQTDSPSRVPVLAVRRVDRAPDAPAAFLVHGWQCNKSMMQQLARYLALNGVDAYAIDLPGHGASPEPHRDERMAPVAAEALEYLVRREGLREDRIVLVGHSFGATVLGRVVATDPGYAGVVFLGPARAQGLTPDLPRRLLVITAEHDYDFIVRAAGAIVSDATGGSLSMPGAWSGNGRTRAWHVEPGLGHVGLVLSPRVFRRVLDAVEASTDHPASGPERLPATIETVALVLLLPLLLAIPFLARGPLPSPTSAPAGWRAIPLLILACAWLGAILVVGRAVPLEFLRLREGETLASLALVSGGIALTLDLALCRGAHLPAPATLARAVPAALGAVATLYAVGLLLVERNFYHVAISPSRAAVAIVVAAGVLPLFAFLEGLLPPGGVRRAIAVALVFAVAALSLALLRARLERFGPALFAFGTACAVLGTAVARGTRNSAASAVFSALMAGWIVAVGFARY